MANFLYLKKLNRFLFSTEDYYQLKEREDLKPTEIWNGFCIVNIHLCPISCVKCIAINILFLSNINLFFYILGNNSRVSIPIIKIPIGVVITVGFPVAMIKFGRKS